MIEGFFFTDDDEPEPCVAVAVELPLLRISSERLDFVIDTGASATVLHPYDLMRRLGMTEEAVMLAIRDGHREKRLGVGGEANVIVTAARYTFTHTDGRQQNLVSSVRVAEPSPTNMYLPPILGWDLLRNFVIHLDWKEQSVTLS